MTQPYRFEPDLEFIRDVMRSGGDSVKKCFQCATCSVVCPLSPDDSPFPRKEMIQTQWGMKDKLLSDPDIWLCHNCNDCSTNCPRGAKPGDVLNALRQKALEHYSPPKGLAKRVSDPKALPFLFGLPAIFFVIVILFTNSWFKTEMTVHGETMNVADLGIRSWKMIPMLAVDITFILTMCFAVGVFVVGITRFWKDLDARNRRQMGIIPAAIEVITEILTHKNFKECGTNQERYLGHLGIFYGFIALAIVTTCIFLGVYFVNLVVHVPLTPWAQYNPIKILANLGGLAVLAGCFLVFQERRREDRDSSNSYFDWFLLGLVATVVASGLLAEITRLIGIGFVYYLLYFVHLVAIFGLFAYSPYSKLGHVIYRTVALVHAKASGRYLMQRAPIQSVAATVQAAEAPVAQEAAE